jgi:hypothetical protein
MMKLATQALVLLLLGCAALATAETSPGSMSDSELLEKLVAGSPWKGIWEVAGYRGTVELVFVKKNGQLQGFTQNTTGSPIRSDGPMSSISVKSGKVEYRTLAGSDYTLQLDREGNLSGTFLSPQRRLGSATFSPSGSR